MVEYLEKMIPTLIGASLVLGMDLKGRIWCLGLKGKGRAREGEKEKK